MKPNALKFLKKHLHLVVFTLLGAVALLSSLNRSPITTNEPISMESVDTFIPKGFVLIPVDLQNVDSLSSIVGELGGVVDLYTVKTETTPGGLKIGSRLKMLRAPLNPHQYAVLVPESESQKVLAFPGPFIAAIQNPDEKGSQITSHEKQTFKVNIQYHN